MEYVKLHKQSHDYKLGMTPEPLPVNVKTDCVFLDENEEVIGFYVRRVTGDAPKFAAIANAELRSDRVPKSVLERVGGRVSNAPCQQYSALLGSIPPKAVMRRNYANTSSVHRKDSAKTFCKAMLKLARECENIIAEITPEIFERQTKMVEQLVHPRWRFGRMFTSSISNYNIAANYHQDNQNQKQTVNAIYGKRSHSLGGDLHIPDYGVVINSSDDSLIVYPAWRNMHAVTPIENTREDGYRNTLVFYPVRHFFNGCKE